MDKTSKTTIQVIKDRLLNYRDRDREIDNEIERIWNQRDRMTSLKSPEMSGMPHATNTESDRIGNMLARIEEMEQHVKLLIDCQDKERLWIRGVLKHVKSADERACIEIRYIDRESWPKVAEILFSREGDYEEKRESYIRQTTRLHGRALQQMAEFVESQGEGLSIKDV